MPEISKTLVMQQMSEIPVRVEKGSKCYVNKLTSLKNPREEAVRRAIIGEGLSAYYEWKQYPLSGGKAYYPDFIVSASIGGRQLVLEPHGPIGVEYLNKLMEFKSMYNFYVVIISWKKPKNRCIDSSKPSEYVDEYWGIRDFRNEVDNIPAIKYVVSKKLSGLLRRKDVELQ